MFAPHVKIVVVYESMSRFVVGVGVLAVGLLFRVRREEMDRPKDTPALKQRT